MWILAGESAPRAAESCVPDACDAGFELEPASPWARASEVPWREIATSRPVWALTAAHSASNFFGYFALSWLPTYFNYQFQLSAAQSSAASLLPFVAAAVGGLSSGYITDAIVERTGVSLTAARKSAQSVAFLGPAAALISLALLGSGAVDIPFSRETAETLFIVALGCQV